MSAPLFALIWKRPLHIFEVKEVERVDASAVYWKSRTLTLRPRLRSRELASTPRCDVLAFFNRSSEAVDVRDFLAASTFIDPACDHETLARTFEQMATVYPSSLHYATQVGYVR